MNDIVRKMLLEMSEKAKARECEAARIAALPWWKKITVGDVFIWMFAAFTSVAIMLFMVASASQEKQLRRERVIEQVEPKNENQRSLHERR